MAQENLPTDHQVETLSRLWQQLFQSNRLNVCVDALEGLSPLDINVLRLIRERPEIIIKEIIDALQVAGSTLTGVLDRLEKRGLIQRVVSQRDRRAIGLELSIKGGQALDEHAAGQRVVIHNLLSALDSDEERQAFIRMFTKLVQE